MKKRLADKIHEKKEREVWGKGTIVCNSWDDFEKKAEDCGWNVVSPGGAADMLGVSRSYINQLEKEGKIRAFRIIVDDKEWKDVPFWLKVFTPKKAVYVYIPVKDLEKIKLLTEEALITLSRHESESKYKLLLSEISEMSKKIAELRQRANIGLQFIENAKK